MPVESCNKILNQKLPSKIIKVPNFINNIKRTIEHYENKKTTFERKDVKDISNFI